MVKEALDKVADAASEVAKDMSDENPFMAVLLVVVIVLLGWLVWDNHRMQKDLIGIKLNDLESSHSRMQRIDKFTELLTEMERERASANEIFMQRMDDLDQRDRQHFEKGVGHVDRILAELETINASISEKLDMVIQNQQIRSVVGRQQQQAQ